VGAIKVGTVGSNIAVDWEKCSYCGICVNICPTGVYGIREKSYVDFLNSYVDKISESGLLNLSCKKIDKASFAKDENPPVLMECLGIIGLTDILYFYTHGAKQIELRFPDCAGCVNKFGYEIVEDELEELRKLTEYFEYLAGTEIASSIVNNERVISIHFPKSFEKPIPVAMQQKEAKEKETVSRRGMFQLLRQSATDTAIRSAALLTPQNLPERTPFRKDKAVPIKRRLFLDSLTQLGKLLKIDMPVGAYFYNQSISDKCKFCKICVRFCHSGALSTNEETAGSFALNFNASICTACGMCKVSCYHKLIKSEKTLDMRTFFDEIALHKVE
jgi:ferredoxin